MDAEVGVVRSTPFKDAGNCDYYAKFASHLHRREAEWLYWTFFLLIIFSLFITSWRYNKAQDAVERFSAQSEQHRGEMRKCLFACCGLGAPAVVLCVLEVYLLLALQFCDGEPLISLYWSTWTVMSVGCVIAILGIILAISHSLQERKHPPWSLALGTPVLVVAGLGHACHVGITSTAKSIRSSRRDSRGREPGQPDPPDQNESLSQAPTIRAQSEDPNSRIRRPTVDTADYNAKLLAFTPEGDLIIRLAPSVRLEMMDIPKPRQQSVTFAETAPTLEKPSSAELSDRTMA